METENKPPETSPAGARPPLSRPNSPVEVLITVALPDPLVSRLKEINPRLRITVHPARKPEDITPEQWGRVDVLYTDRVLPAPEAAPRLRWVQFHLAGIDSVADAPILQNPEITTTTLSGAAVSQMGEYVLMMLLAMGHHIPDMVAYQAKAEWPRDRFERLQPH
ncbi:MAG TPA: hypothetical protein VF813_12095, partial [Anaerolineaceae bacterium]